MRSARALASLGAALLAASLGAGCSLFHRAPPKYDARPGRYDAVDSSELEAAERARRLLDDEEFTAACEVLRELVAARPEHIGFGRMLQDAELAGGTPSEELALAARARAEESPSPATLLLAARLEPDTSMARAQVDEALTLDPKCVWAHYAHAHLDARDGRWDAVHVCLARAIALDPGHLPSRRLAAARVARNGRRPDAILALERWIAASEHDPFVEPTDRTLAELDLAQLLVLERENQRALERLQALVDAPTGAARRLTLLAATEQALGRPNRALAAASRASQVDPHDPLPLVQQALLYQEWLADPAAAREAWTKVLENASASGGLGALILSMRARIALERSAESAASDAAQELDSNSQDSIPATP